MTKPTISITDDAVAVAIRAFFLSIVPDGVEVFRGQGNRVPEPEGLDFVVFTATARNRLATNVVTWDRGDPDVASVQNAHSVQYEVQLDIHGPRGSDIGGVIATLMRSEYGCENVDSLVAQPLYATDGHQMPFFNAEHQYEDRWVMTAAFQITPIVSTDQQFAVTLEPTLLPVQGA